MNNPLRTLVLLLPCAVLADQPAGDRPAHRAEDFVESLGLNAAPFDRYVSEGRWKGAGTKYDPAVFFDLGIRYYRMGLRNDLVREEQPALVEDAWRRTGARPLLLVDPHKSNTLKDDARGVPEDGDFARLLADLKRYAPGSVAGVVGPNEVNNKFPPQELNLRYRGLMDEAAGARYQRDLFAALRGDPATADLPVVMFTAIFTDYRLARPCDAFDFLSTHPYQGPAVPSAALLMNLTRAANILPVGAVIPPFHLTECGYNVEEDKTNQQGYRGTRAAQAYNIPMLYAEYFRHGIGRTYLFALHNADGYGLLESDQATKRPSWHAVRSFVALLADAVWNPAALRWEGGRDFAPRTLRFTIEGAPDSIRTLTLQRQNGDFDLLIWNEQPILEDGRLRMPPPAPVTLRFAPETPVECRAVYAQGALTDEDDFTMPENALRGAFAPLAATPVVQDGALLLEVPARVLILRLRPTADTAGPGQSPDPAPPLRVAGEATENAVDLTVQLPSDPRAVSVLVFRNDRHIATLPVLPDRSELCYADRSAWIRPGLTYRYAAQTVAADGRMSPRVAGRVTTPDRRPDLVVGAFGPILADGATPRVGERLRFHGTVRNVGDGATPQAAPATAGMWNSAVALTFAINGKVVGWGGDGGQQPLAAGSARHYELSGGPLASGWEATQGTHVLRAVADDINRISSERDKANNVASRTLTVGAYPGLLTMESRPAPGRVDLSVEGTVDWVHFGGWKGAGTVSRKRGAGRIAPVEQVGSGHMAVTTGSPVQLVWSDGAGVAQQPGTHAGLWGNCKGNGYVLSVPADRTEHVLRVYVSAINGARGAFAAELSDGSAPAFVCDAWNGNRGPVWAAVPDGFSAVYAVRYRAATDGATLRVTWTLADEPNRFAGQIRLQAATLARP